MYTKLFDWLEKLINRIRTIWIVPIVLIHGVIIWYLYYGIDLPPILSIPLIPCFYIIIYYKTLSKCQRHYTIKCNNYKILKTGEKLLFTGKHIDFDGNTCYIFFTNIPLSSLNREIERFSMMLNTNIIEISKFYNSKSIIKIVTNKVKIDYKQKAKLKGLQLNEKISASFKHLGLHMSNIAEINKPYKTTVYFNSNQYLNEIDKRLEDIKNLTKVRDIELYSDDKFDYKIIRIKTINSISFKDLLLSEQLNDNANIIVGVNNEAELKIVDIKELYHGIIAGSTGNGKSNASHVIISSILKSDIDMSLVLLDIKKSELKRYRDIERVYYSGDQVDILESIEKIVAEIERRNELIESEKFVNNLETWNKKHPNNKMGYILLYVEEIADLVLSNDKKYVERFNNCITRIGQVGRSVGCRMYLTTQYPRADVISSLIRINCLTRLCFGVDTPVESKIVIGNDSCSKLTKKGEVIFRLSGKHEKLQIPHLKDTDIESVVDFLEKRHNDTANYPLGNGFVKTMSGVSSEVIPEGEACHEAVPDEKIEINSLEDLILFYDTYGMMSLNKTVPHVNIGRTKLQKLRKHII